MRVFRLVLPWSSVITTSAAYIFVPAGPWANPFGFKTARADSEFRGMVNLNAQAALQFADDEEGTGAVVTVIGQTMTADGFYPPLTAGVADISVNAARYRYVRPGWNIKATAGTAFGRVGGVADLSPV